MAPAPERLLPLAFGPDGFPKIKKFYRQDNSTVIERVEYDFSGDGRVDLTQYLSADGTYVQKESSDLDGDGFVDVNSYFKKSAGAKEAELVMQDFDTQFKGRPNLWKYFSGNDLVQREIDRRGRGVADYWEFYEKRRLVRVEKDEDLDGRPDSRIPYQKIIQPRGSPPDSDS